MFDSISSVAAAYNMFPGEPTQQQQQPQSRRPRASSVGRLVIQPTPFHTIEQQQEQQAAHYDKQQQHKAVPEPSYGGGFLQRSYSMEEPAAPMVAPAPVVVRTRTPLRGRWPPTSDEAASNANIPMSPRPMPLSPRPIRTAVSSQPQSVGTPRAAATANNKPQRKVIEYTVKSPSSALQRRLNRRSLFGGNHTNTNSATTELEDTATTHSSSQGSITVEQPPPPHRNTCAPTIQARMRAFSSDAHLLMTTTTQPATPKAANPTTPRPLTSQHNQKTTSAATTEVASSSKKTTSPPQQPDVATAFLNAIQKTTTGGGVPDVIPDEDTESVSMMSNPSVESPTKQQQKHTVLFPKITPKQPSQNHQSSHHVQSDWDKLVDDRVRVKLLEMERRMEGRLQVAIEHVEVRMEARIRDLERRLLSSRSSYGRK